jgi:hypothetical protein
MARFPANFWSISISATGEFRRKTNNGSDLV